VHQQAHTVARPPRGNAAERITSGALTGTDSVKHVKHAVKSPLPKLSNLSKPYSSASTSLNGHQAVYADIGELLHSNRLGSAIDKVGYVS